MTPSVISPSRGRRQAEGRYTHEPSWVMKGPLVILALFSLGGGFLPLKQFVPLEHEAHGPFLVTVLGLVVGTAGLLFTLYLYLFQPETAARLGRNLRGPRQILEKKYYVDEIYNALIRYVQDGFAKVCDVFERYIIVGLCVNGAAYSTRFMGHLARQLQTGRIQFYALVFSLGVTLITYGFLLWKH